VRNRLIALAIFAAMTLAGTGSAVARHEDPNCVVTIHPPVVGQVKVSLGCEHGGPNHP
jgi:hypothetical protein